MNTTYINLLIFFVTLTLGFILWKQTQWLILHAFRDSIFNLRYELFLTAINNNLLKKKAYQRIREILNGEIYTANTIGLLWILNFWNIVKDQEFRNAANGFYNQLESDINKLPRDAKKSVKKIYLKSQERFPILFFGRSMVGWILLIITCIFVAVLFIGDLIRSQTEKLWVKYFKEPVEKFNRYPNYAFASNTPGSTFKISVKES